MKAVRFDEYGDIDVLKVVDVPTPVPGPGQVLVEVKAAGINPGEGEIHSGLRHSRWRAAFPSGQGSDLAGVVAATGSGVTGFATGNEVIGYTDNRASQAEIRRGRGAEPDRQARGRAVGGCRGAERGRGDRLCRRPGRRADRGRHRGGLRCGGRGRLAGRPAGQAAGAIVIGLASPANHTWLTGHGVIPVAYGDGVADRIRQAAGKVDAFIDTFGADYVQLALDLGVEPSRIDTIVRFDAVDEYGVKAEGNAAGASAGALAQLARLIADGQLEVPIAATYPLSQVREAYQRLASGHILGKIVLIP